MTLFRQVELAAILVFPLVAVLVGHKAALVPKEAVGRFDRFLARQLQVHASGLCWSISAANASMIRRREVRGSRWGGGSGSISVGRLPMSCWSTRRPVASASPRP